LSVFFSEKSEAPHPATASDSAINEIAINKFGLINNQSGRPEISTWFMSWI